jgi:hypothetical protein
MPLNPALFYSNFNKTHGYTGKALPMIISAIATGTYNWISGSGLNTLSKCAGSSGVGDIKGKISCPPPDVSGLISLAEANGMGGDAVGPLISSISLGFVETMNTALYSGTSSSVSTGTEGLTIIYADAGSLQNQILSNFTSTGEATPQFCMAIAQVIAKISLTCIGVGVIAPKGPVAPTPSLGLGSNITIF